MLIVLAVYLAAVWLVFFQLKILPWNLWTKIAASLVGLLILVTFVAMLNTRTPSGRVAVMSPVGDVATVVSGTVTAIPVRTHQTVQKGDVLLQLDKRPFKFAADQARSNYNLAEINYKRIDEAIKKSASAFSRRQLDEARANFEATSSALELAKYNLERTAVIAPGNGILGPVELRVGDKVAAFKPVMGLVRAGDARIWGVFQQNGSDAIKVGTDVAIAMRNEPGVVRWSKILEVAPATSGGQSNASAQLVGQGTIGNSGELLVILDWPEGVTTDDIKVGMIGTATVIGPDSGAIGSLASILIRIKALMNYL